MVYLLCFPGMVTELIFAKTLKRNRYKPRVKTNTKSESAKKRKKKKIGADFGRCDIFEYLLYLYL